MIELYEKPQRSRIIIGFPGFGLIGTITTEYLIEHLGTRLIGKILFKGIPSNVAIHNGKLIDPIGIYYNEKYNIIIIRGMVAAKGLEWDITDKLKEAIDQLDPYEVIDIEGVASQNPSDESKVFYYSNSEERKTKLNEAGITELKDGIVIGITSTILLRIKKDIICLFAESHSELPDSKSAAKIIETLDKYMGLNLDINPLLEQSKIFEQKLKKIIKQSDLAQKEADKKSLNYLG